MKGKLRIARIYDEKSPDDGYRILVDRLWPRGVRKEKAGIQAWLKSIAPAGDLRKEYHKDQDYETFQRKYADELDQNEDTAALISCVREHLERENVTLLTASKNVNACNASALQSYLLEKL